MNHKHSLRQKANLPWLRLSPRRLQRVFLRGAGWLAMCVAAAFLHSCTGATGPRIARGEMGERVTVENISYTVLGADWVEAIGEGVNARIPEHRFLLLRVSANNDSGSPAEMGIFKIIASNGTEYDEIANGAGVAEWLGMARELDAKDSRQGVVLFDAPKAVYELQVADAFYDGESGSAALIQIPIRPEAKEPAVSGALP